jgi:hypothetical protein
MATETRAALDVLVSIEGLLKQLVKQGQSASGSTGAIASDRDLDGQYGDPEVRAKDPRDWNGPSMKGRHFSECPPEYLDLIAERLDYFAEQADEEGKKTEKGQPVSKYNRADAARARGWAKRIRDGRHVQTTPATSGGAGWADGPNDDDIPFAWLLPLVLPALAVLGRGFV